MRSNSVDLIFAFQEVVAPVEKLLYHHLNHVVALGKPDAASEPAFSVASGE